MYRKHLMVVGAASALLVSTAAWSGPHLTTDKAHSVNFANYKTFTWADTTPPAGYNSVQYHRVMAGITQSLKNKGYVHDPHADLTLALTVGKLRKVDLDSWQHWGYHDAYVRHEGQVSLDAFDSKTKLAVWHGQVSDAINPKKPDADKLMAAVSQMMDQFPTH